MSTVFAVVDRLPYGVLHSLVVPRGVSGTDAVSLARAELRRHVATFAGRRCATWQDAWNEMTGASPDRPGTLRIVDPPCPTCQGKPVVTNGSAMMRGMSRGLPAGMCPDCRGRRVGPSLAMPARWAATPDDAPR